MTTTTQTKRIVEAGIGQRMVNSIYKFQGRLDPPLTFTIEECNFWVVVKKLDDDDHVQVVIEYPMHAKGGRRVTQGFGVREEGSGFGAFGEAPLTHAQFELVMKLTRES